MMIGASAIGSGREQDRVERTGTHRRPEGVDVDRPVDPGDSADSVEREPESELDRGQVEEQGEEHRPAVDVGQLRVDDRHRADADAEDLEVEHPVVRPGLDVDVEVPAARHDAEVDPEADAGWRHEHDIGVERAKGAGGIGGGGQFESDADPVDRAGNRTEGSTCDHGRLDRHVARADPNSEMELVDGHRSEPQPEGDVACQPDTAIEHQSGVRRPLDDR